MKGVFERIIEKLVEKHNLVEFAKMPLSAKNSAKVAYDASIEIVKQAAAEYNNGWIPCSKPPKTGVYVLLSFSNFSVPTVGRYEENEQGGAYYIGDEDETCIQQDMFVDAWQPLPAPYQPKGE